MKAASRRTIVVGAGSSGIPLAVRLAEAEPDHDVVLFEAGSHYRTPAETPPELRFGTSTATDITTTSHDWGYSGVMVPGRDPVRVPRGRVVGGTSFINGQTYLRGDVDDYDAWAALGNPGWDFASVLPAFRRSEHDLDVTGDAHGDSGPIRVRRYEQSSWLAPQRAFFAACRDLGFATTDDHNAPESTGVGPLPINNVSGERMSTARCYLQDGDVPDNLTIEADAQVHRIVIDGTRATGVRGVSGGAAFRLDADEVILCAGAIGSAHLLLLSGIGPADDLRRYSIDVAHDLPGVGSTVLDHPHVDLQWRAAEPLPLGDASAPRFQLGLRCTGTDSGPRNAVLIVPSSFGTKREPHGALVPEPNSMSLVVMLADADSVGSLRLASADPTVQPILDYRLLESSHDRELVRAGVELSLELARTSTLIQILGDRLEPALGSSTDEIDRWIREVADTSHHISSTCKMGPTSDPSAVVDHVGRVHGLKALRVADASIIPRPIRANINATCVMIGERIASLMSSAPN